MVAALYVETGGVYYGLPDVDPWDEERDAKIYARRAISEAHFGPVDERGGSA